MATEAPPAAKQAKASMPLKQLFLKLKPCSIILLLKDSQQSWYPSKLARSAGMSYVHTVNLLSELRFYGMVTVEKKGKQNVFHLTEKGAYLALTLDDLVKKCETAEAERKVPKQEAPPAHAAPEAAPAKEKAAAGSPAPEAKREAKHESAEKK